MKNIKLNFAAIVSLVLAFSMPALAAKKVKKERKYINLVVGLSYDEKAENIPPSPKFDGNYKSITGVSYASEIKTLRFTPTKEGTATMSIMAPNGSVVYEYILTARKSNLNKVANEIQSLLVDIEGIQVRILNNKVIVDGQVLLPQDLNRVYTVVSQYGAQASTIVTLSPVAQRKIAELIERDINNPEISVRPVNGRFIIEGVAKDIEEKQRAEIKAKLYVPDVVVNRAEADGVIKKVKVSAVVNMLGMKPAPEPEPGKTIKLVVHFVELQKDYQKGFRFQWTPDLKDGTSVQFQTDSRSPGGLISTLTGTISNLLPKLNWAKQHGFARVLQSSSIIVQDGQAGTIKSTTRVPYQIIGQGGVPGTAFEEAGLVSKITPQIIGTRSDSMNLKIDFEVKDLLGITDKGPLTSNRYLNTVIVVRSKQSAAVGGLVTNQSGTNYNKLPKNVSENPLFSLYASKDFRREQSQFVVFITPVIQASASVGSDRIREMFRIPD
ncbi:MAG: pilus assembly protein [Bdellovibrionales bacterium]|nr:pilus assembly protein [Bdellovibrionales bacterium]